MRTYAGLWSWCWLATVLLVLVAVAWFDFPGLGHYDPFYDTGVYLESARMINHGYAAYDRVFSSQPPLWLPLVRLSFFVVGEKFLGGQLLVATASLITVAAVMATVAQVQGRAAAILAAVIMMLAPTQLVWSRAVIAEGPCMAFAATALAFAARYHHVSRPLWLVLAAIAITCSILTKLFGIYTVPSILLLVFARLDARQQNGRSRFVGLARDLSIMLLISAGLVLALASVVDPLMMWDQAVQFHLKARSSQASADLSQSLFDYWRSDSLLWAIAPITVFSVLGGWRALAVLLWMLCTLIGLLQQQPVFSHHLIALVPGLAAAAAIGLGQLWRWHLRWVSRARMLPGRLLALGSGAVCVAVGLFVASALLTQARADQELRRWVGSDREAAKADKMVASQLKRLTRANDFVLTDAPSVAFLANREVPPGLTDTSFKRISTHYLSERQVIAECERFHVSAVLLWTGRLARMPDVVTWVARRFPQHKSFGKGRKLYVRTNDSQARLTNGH